MRNLADLLCPNCSVEYYGDLPSGQGLYTPFLLEKESGTVSGKYNAAWFADWLEKSYKRRGTKTRQIDVRRFSDVKDKVVLLNCLDTLYGHSLLKLLNAQYYLDHKTDYSLIVIVPKFLEWMLPDGIAEAWVIDLPLREGTEWNDQLAFEIDGKLQPFAEVFVSPAFSHPHSKDFDITRFTRVAPFNLETFADVPTTPVITFIWRGDRLWETERRASLFGGAKGGLADQVRKVAMFADHLRTTLGEVDFAIAGLGETGGLPVCIQDLRMPKPDDETEHLWCERYAASHVVVGIHGSNMLLPSAHAGSVIEIIGEERAGNFLQDLVIRGSDARETMFRYRFVPHSITPEALAHTVSNVLRYDEFCRLMSPRNCRHQDGADLGELLMNDDDKEGNR